MQFQSKKPKQINLKSKTNKNYKYINIIETNESETNHQKIRFIWRACHPLSFW